MTPDDLTIFATEQNLQRERIMALPCGCAGWATAYQQNEKGRWCFSFKNLTLHPGCQYHSMDPKHKLRVRTLTPELIKLWYKAHGYEIPKITQDDITVFVTEQNMLPPETRQLRRPCGCLAVVSYRKRQDDGWGVLVQRYAAACHAHRWSGGEGARNFVLTPTLLENNLSLVRRYRQASELKTPALSRGSDGSKSLMSRFQEIKVGENGS